LKKAILFVSLAMLMHSHAQAKTAFTGQDYSGVYNCSGDDAHEGKYTGKVTLAIKPEHSYGSYASYDFKLEVPGFGSYPGHAAGNGSHLAMHFALTDQTTKDYGTGVAAFKKNRQGRWSFHKFYYEPEFKSGNTGTEDCVLQK
jgi:hypothetical protein